MCAPSEEGAATAAPVAQISLSVGLRGGGGIGGGGAQEGAEVKTSTTNAAATVANGQAGLPPLPLPQSHSSPLTDRGRFC